MSSKHGKQYTAALDLVDRNAKYLPSDAVGLVKKITSAKFDETVEIHMRTSADPRHADQQLRGVVVLPHGIGRPVRVAVFAEGDAARSAKDAGAEVVGADDLIGRIEDGFLEFDVAIATPDLMGKIGKLGRILGRRGLMPNPRTDTVVQPDDVRSAVENAKKGRVELRMDKTAIIHSPIGKVSFDEGKLLENMAAVMDTINRLRPTTIKGPFVKSIFLTTTMGPGIPLDLPSALALREE